MNQLFFQIDFINRAAAKSIPNLCEYNNEYQYFLNDYFYPALPVANHSCLLHFISGNALRDMSHFFPKEDSVIFFLPGISFHTFSNLFTQSLIINKILIQYSHITIIFFSLVLFFFFFFLGSAIQPIDFSYALLEPNECDYLDVDVSFKIYFSIIK